MILASIVVIVIGILLFNLGALTVLLAVMTAAFKVCLFVLLALIGWIIWRRFRYKRITWRKL
jgi:membrane protein implicated in regulation of membrane protease activity